jgi:hypothetical protein
MLACRSQSAGTFRDGNCHAVALRLIAMFSSDNQRLIITEDRRKAGAGKSIVALSLRQARASLGTIVLDQ